MPPSTPKSSPSSPRLAPLKNADRPAGQRENRVTKLTLKKDSRRDSGNPLPAVGANGLTVNREIFAHDEEEFASARGESQFESALEYDNLSSVMDSRFNVQTLKSRKEQATQSVNNQPAISAASQQQQQMSFRKPATTSPNMVSGSGESGRPQPVQYSRPPLAQNTQPSQFLQTFTTVSTVPQHHLKAHSSLTQPAPRPAAQLSLHPLVEVPAAHPGALGHAGLQEVPRGLGLPDALGAALPHRPEQKGEHLEAAQGLHRQRPHQDRLPGLHERADLDAPEALRVLRVQGNPRPRCGGQRRRPAHGLRAGLHVRALLQHAAANEEALQPAARRNLRPQARRPRRHLRAGQPPPPDLGLLRQVPRLRRHR